MIISTISENSVTSVAVTMYTKPATSVAVVISKELAANVEVGYLKAA